MAVVDANAGHRPAAVGRRPSPRPRGTLIGQDIVSRLSRRLSAVRQQGPMARPLALTAAAATALVAASAARRTPRPVIVGGFLGLLAGLSVAATRTVTRLDAAWATAELEKTASHNQLQKLIDNSNANIYMKRVDNGRYLLVNREWERLFRVPRNRIINMTDHDVFPLALADQLRANDLGVARAGRTVQYEETAESEDGMRTYVSVKFPVLDGAGAPYAICGISTDITERKRAEDEVRRLNAELEMRVRERTAELEASTRELDAFAYSVSHDLRAPLRSLHGFSDALLDDYGDVLDDEGRDNLHRLQHNVQRMGRMIDDLLNLSRATRVDLTRDHINLSTMAHDIIADLVMADPDRTVTVTVADDLRAHGDPQLVRLALQNLLANAWKFTAHRADPCIEVGSTQHDGETVFFVRDNGAGFDMKYANKLFNAFQRLHAVAQFEGTGIGLAIVARVVRRHGGRVFAHAEVDRGATFFFNLHTNTTGNAP
jgi:PAS domain S-box-containing protein